MVFSAYSTLYRCIKIDCGKCSYNKNDLFFCVKNHLGNDESLIEKEKVEVFVCELCENRYLSKHQALFCEFRHRNKKDSHWWARHTKISQRPQSKLVDSKNKFIY